MKQNPKFHWLDRQMAHEGPDFTLVRSEKDYFDALLTFNLPMVGPWINPEPCNATCHNFVSPEGLPVSIVAIRVEPEHTGVEICGLLVHEAVHIVQEYFANMGETSPASEQQACAVQKVSQELMLEYRRQVYGA